ncbi:MAG: cytochrome c [Xanthobacter sp.]
MMRTILKNAGLAVAFSGTVLAAGAAFAEDASQKAAYVARAEQLILETCDTCGSEKNADDYAQNLVKALKATVDLSSPEPYDLIYVLLVGAPAHGDIPAVPAFAGRLNDQQLADLANYVRGALDAKKMQSVRADMVATLRATRAVPDYGSQAAEVFDCPVVGGEPGSYGAPDPKAVASLSAMLAGGERSIPVLVDAYRSDDPKAGPSVVVDALAAAYCPVVAASDAPYYQRVGELRRFILEAADDVFPRTLRAKVTNMPIVWAVPAGDSLVLREPRTQEGELACPAPEKSGVPQDLAAAAVTVLGTPAKLPVSGEDASKAAQALMTDVPNARLAYAANALISAYCQVVSASTSIETPQKKAFVNSFGSQVIQTLQMEPARLAAAAAEKK